MNEIINLTDVQPNDVLIWSDIEEKFVNIEPSPELFNIPPMEMKVQPLSPNAQLIRGIKEGDTIQQRGIVAGNNINVQVNATDIIISATYDGEAETLSGYTHMDFVKREQLNSLIDMDEVLKDANIYTRSDAHDVFMESNASNIPDKDNTYDLGSNGRRYADIFAVTFHGTATKATIAQGLTQNGASEGDVLTWYENKWRPLSRPPVALDSITDIDLSGTVDGNILQYDHSSKKWKSVAIEVVADKIDVPRNSFRNVGRDGVGIFHQTMGLDVQLRSLKAGEGIHIQEDPSDDRHIMIALDEAFMESLEFTTDEVAEGNNNLYHTNERVIKTVRDQLAITDLPFVDTSEIATGKVAFWDGTRIAFMDVEIPEFSTSLIELEDVDATSIEEGQLLLWNGEKFVPHTLPDNNTDLLAELDTSDATGKFLSWNGSEYGFEEIVVGQTLDDLNVTDATGKFLSWNGSEFTFEEIKTGTTLDDIDTTSADDGYVLTWNGHAFVLRVIGEGGGPVASDTLAEVNTVGASDGFVVTWNGSGYVLRAVPEKTYALADLSDVEDGGTEGQVLTYTGTGFAFTDIPVQEFGLGDLMNVNGTAQAGQVLAFDGSEYSFVDLPEMPEVPETFSVDAIEEFGELEDGKFLAVEAGKIVSKELNIDVVEQLTELSDVNIASLEDGKMLVVQDGQVTLGDVPVFEQEDVSLGDLTDVDSATADGQALVYRDGKYTFETIEIPDTPEYALSDLTDVSISETEDGKVLTYQDGVFTLQSLPEGVTSLAELDDVDTTSMQSGDVLSWDGSKFVATTIEIPEPTEPVESITRLVELEDVAISALEDGKFLSVEGGTVVLKDIPVSNNKLYEMADVDIEVLEVGHFLQWDGNAFSLAPVSVDNPEVGLGDLTDVDTAGATEGQALVFNGSGYSFQTITSGGSGVESFVDLSDVSISSLTDGKYLAVDNGSIVEVDLPSVNVLSASDVDAQGVTDGQVLTYEGGALVFKTVETGTGDATTSLLELDEVDIASLENDKLLGVSDGKVVLVDTPQSGVSSIEDLDEVTLTSIADGQVLMYQDGEFVNRDLPVQEFSVLNASDVSGTPSDGQFLAFRDGGLVFENVAVEDGIKNIVDLGDVDITSLEDGKVLTVSNGSVVLGDLPVQDEVVTEFTELSDVAIDSLTEGNFLKVEDGKITQAPIEMKTSLATLDDVTLDNPSVGQVLTWDGEGFVLSTADAGSEGATRLVDLDDVDETVEPSDGDMLVYDAASGKYRPLPIDLGAIGGSGPSNGARYEIVRINHNPDDSLKEVIPYTDGVVHVGTPNPDINAIEVQFPGYRFPPLSIYTYGYVYSQNYYNVSPVTASQELLQLDGLGEVGSPLAFEDRGEDGLNYTLTVSARTSETRASGGMGFPPPPTHAFIVFVMGG